MQTSSKATRPSSAVPPLLHLLQLFRIAAIQCDLKKLAIELKYLIYLTLYVDVVVYHCNLHKYRDYTIT